MFFEKTGELILKAPKKSQIITKNDCWRIQAVLKKKGVEFQAGQNVYSILPYMLYFYSWLHVFQQITASISHFASKIKWNQMMVGWDFWTVPYFQIQIQLLEENSSVAQSLGNSTFHL